MTGTNTRPDCEHTETRTQPLTLGWEYVVCQSCDKTVGVQANNPPNTDESQDAIPCVACEMGDPEFDLRHNFRGACQLPPATPYIGLMNPVDVEGARGWLLDCMGCWHDIDGGLEDEIRALTPIEVARAIAKYYEGGIAQFARDAGN